VSVPVTAAGVGGLYGARSADGVLDGWLVDTSDTGTDVPGVAVRDCPLWMTDENATLDIVRRALELAEEIR
jgi:LPPG:FO 2-phospho-L-lactate transferase